MPETFMAQLAQEWWRKRIAEGNNEILLQQWANWWAIPNMMYGVMISDRERHDISGAAWIELLFSEMCERGL